LLDKAGHECRVKSYAIEEARRNLVAKGPESIAAFDLPASSRLTRHRWPRRGTGGAAQLETSRLRRHLVKSITPAQSGAPMTAIHDTIKEQVTQNRVVLYMKGTPQFPQCGFSATVAGILKRCGVADYASFNVLEDDALRQGIKNFSNWPTVPQLYVDGEFVGGCDIVREMYESGELQQLLAEQPA
jgi:monothiol glutaredoxin